MMIARNLEVENDDNMFIENITDYGTSLGSEPGLLDDLEDFGSLFFDELPPLLDDVHIENFFNFDEISALQSPSANTNVKTKVPNMYKARKGRSKRCRRRSPWPGLPEPKLKKPKLKLKKENKKKSNNKQTIIIKKCTHCEITETPQWRTGPMGPKTLCNACGVRYKSGQLFPEYRPAASPTFVPCLHSNLHKMVLEIRNYKSTLVNSADSF